MRFTPRLSSPLPDGWLAKESITLLEPTGRANVIASSEPLDPEIDVHRYAAAQGEILKAEFDAFQEIAFEQMVVFGGRTGYMRRFRWEPGDREPVTQIQLYCVEAGRGYTATATSPISEYAHFETQLVEVLEGLVISKDA